LLLLLSYPEGRPDAGSSTQKVAPCPGGLSTPTVDLGWFATTGRGTPLPAAGTNSHTAMGSGAGRGAESGERVAPPTGASPEDVKGWMTIQHVLDAFPVTRGALYQRFGIPADTPTDTTLSTLKEAGSLSDFDVPTLRTWLTEHAGG
jgi:hypothetical protein